MMWFLVAGLLTLVGITVVFCFALARAAARGDEQLAMLDPEDERLMPYPGPNEVTSIEGHHWAQSA